MYFVPTYITHGSRVRPMVAFCRVRDALIRNQALHSFTNVNVTLRYTTIMSPPLYAPHQSIFHIFPVSESIYDLNISPFHQRSSRPGGLETMAPSTSRLPDSGDTSLADTPMADGNEDTANQQHGGNLNDSMVVSAQNS